MSVKFLCVNRREQLLADENLAERNWLEWMDQANRYHEEGDINAAIPYLGCAYELSGHLLCRSWPNVATALSRFTASGIGLAKAYHLLGNEKSRAFIIDLTSEHVADSVNDIRCYKLIIDSIAVFNWAAVNLAIQRWYKGVILSNRYSFGSEKYQLHQSAVALH